LGLPGNFSIKCIPKAAFRALDLSIKPSRPFPSALKMDQEIVKNFKIVLILHLLSCFVCLQLTGNTTKCFLDIPTQVCVVLKSKAIASYRVRVVLQDAIDLEVIKVKVQQLRILSSGDWYVLY